MRREICDQLMDFSEFARHNGKVFEYIVYVVRNMVYNSPGKKCRIEDVIYCLEEKARRDKRLRASITRFRVFQAIAYLARRKEIKRIRLVLNGQV